MPNESAAVENFFGREIMAKISLWDRYSSKTLLVSVIMTAGATWGWRISEGKFSDFDALHLIFVFGLIYNLYSTCNKLARENLQLQQELDALKSVGLTSV